MGTTSSSALATWAEGRAAIVSESDGREPIVGFVVGHPHDRAKAQGAGFCGKEEVLSHRIDLSFLIGYR